MPSKLSPLSVLIGLLTSQAISAGFAVLMLIGFPFIYGNKFLVALLEYPSSIAVTMLAGLLATAGGGYICMLTPKKSLLNAILVGVITLAINVGLWAATDFGYGRGQEWLLLLTAILTIPAATLGGMAFLKWQSR